MFIKQRKSLFICLVLVLCCVLAFGCGKKKPKITDPTDPNDPGGEEPIPVERPEITGAIILEETFEGATTENFFTPAYKALPNNSEMSLYYKTGGNFSIADGVLKFDKGARFTIGQTKQETKTTKSTVQPNGAYILTKDYTIMFKVVSVGGDTSKKFLVYVDNNDTSQGASIHGSDSKIFEKPLSEIEVNKYLVITSGVGTSTSFFQLRIETGGEIEITDLVIFYNEREAPEPGEDVSV